MLKALACIAVCVLACSGIALAADAPPTALPRPAFPRALKSVKPSGPLRLALVSSRRRDPAVYEARAQPPAWAPKLFAGSGLLTAIRQGRIIFLLYGRDGTSARYLVAANTRTRHVRYAFDFATFLQPPRIAKGAAALVTEQVVSAREAGGVLYVETAHLTYAAASGGLNGYITAIDLHKRRTIWRSPALVANASTFVLAGNYLVTGYGFTREPDFLYLLDRRTGRVRDRLAVPSAPESIARHGRTLIVDTYDHHVVVKLKGP